MTEDRTTKDGCHLTGTVMSTTSISQATRSVVHRQGGVPHDSIIRGRSESPDLEAMSGIIHALLLLARLGSFGSGRPPKAI